MTVTNEEAVSLTERVDVLCPDGCTPMLVELNAMVSLSRAALQTFATRVNVAAMALVGPTIIDQT